MASQPCVEDVRLSRRKSPARHQGPIVGCLLNSIRREAGRIRGVLNTFQGSMGRLLPEHCLHLGYLFAFGEFQPLIFRAATTLSKNALPPFCNAFSHSHRIEGTLILLVVMKSPRRSLQFFAVRYSMSSCPTATRTRTTPFTRS